MPTAMKTRVVQPTWPPAQPDHTWPAFTRSNCSENRPQVLSSKTRRRRVGFESPHSKLVKPDLPEDIKFSRILQGFRRVFSLIWQISVTKTIRSDIDTLDSTILDTIWGKNHWIWRNPHWILAKSGEISLILDIFLCFPSGFDLTRNRCHPSANRPS